MATGTQGNRDMKDRNREGISARRVVAHRLDSFFAEWIRQLTAGTTAIWSQVERRLGGGSRGGAAEPAATSTGRAAGAEAGADGAESATAAAKAAGIPAPSAHGAMQPQPMQQQQQRKK
jgi:hypothetical protein